MMWLIPLGSRGASDLEDGLWVRPGPAEGWVHPPPPGSFAPEFRCIEPSPILVGTDADCHVRLRGDRPPRICRLSPAWHLEALAGAVRLGGRTLSVGDRAPLADGDVLSLVPQGGAAPSGWRVRLLGGASGRPARFPCRSSLASAQSAPDALWQLAWQTDRMRRRSEEDQVRVADWSAFSQYVKRHFREHGITCRSWSEDGRRRPIDPAPPTRAPLPVSPWIAELLGRERRLPGLERPLPFERVAAGPGDSAAPACVPAPCAPVFTRDSEGDPADALRQWLESLDEAGYLVQYVGRLAATCTSVEQVREVYVQGGELSARFFEDAGVRKLGHRRIFQRWFRDHA